MATKQMLSPDEVKLKPFTTHGLDFTDMSGNDYQSTCPFCGKVRGFHVDPDTTKWVCSSGLDKCGRSGNLTTFIRQYAEFCADNTTDGQYHALSKHRDGLSIKPFKYWKVGFNPLTQEWLVPNHEANGETHDVRRWRPKRKPMGTPGVKAGLWGRHQLHDPAKADWPVWICEGEWDGMAMWHWVRLCGLKVIVVAVPGANIFKEDWLPEFAGRDVLMWYDRDATGDGYSWKKAKLLLEAGVRSMRWHFWPEHYPEKYDVRDHYCTQIVAKGLNAKEELRKCLARLTDVHPLAEEDPVAPSEGGGEDAPKYIKPPYPPHNPGIEETLDVYRKHLRMNRELEDAVKVLYATELSKQFELDVPVWLFLVGPPASGKTALLLSLHKVPGVSYHSSITAKALCSGFKEEKKGEDPSVLKKLIEHGVGVFKDFTQLLGRSNEMELQAVSRLLRGAFDGETEQHFGNGVVRIYKGSFVILAGVTDEIHSYSEATVGERFLKFQLGSLSRRRERDMLMHIGRTSRNRDSESEAMQDAAAAFLHRKMPEADPDRISDFFMNRISGLAQLIAELRHTVSWEKDYGYDKVLRFRPRSESPRRVMRQLTSLAMAFCEVNGVARYGHEEHRLLERVAFNTGIGFNLDIMEAMMGMAGGLAIPRTELAEAARLPRTTLGRRLEDMHLLGMIQPSAKQPVATAIGRQPEYFDVHPEFREIWAVAAPGESHLAAACAARRKRGINRG